jgi:hypothetical protein
MNYIVEYKRKIGDLQTDTIVGTNQNGAITTIINNTSMFVKISILENSK